MRRSVPALVLLGSIGLAPASAQTPADVPVVVMTGEGVVRRAPDRAFLTLTVETTAQHPKEAQQQNAGSMTAVQQKLRSAGLQKDAVRTIGYDLRLEEDFVNGKRVPRGYVVRNTIEARIDDLQKVGEIMDLAVGSGATMVSGVRFDLQQRDVAERDALKQAVADARARADAAAAGAGRSIDRILRIEEQRSMPIVQPRAMFRTAQTEAVQTPIAEGEIEIRAQVILTAVLK